MVDAHNEYRLSAVVYSPDLQVLDHVAMRDEDYGALMNRLSQWAQHSEATKDL